MQVHLTRAMQIHYPILIVWHVSKIRFALMVTSAYGPPLVAVHIARYALLRQSSAFGWPIAKINRDCLTLWYKELDVIMQMRYL